MAEAQYCKDCGRIKGVACNCHLSFKDKVKSAKINWATWSATRNGKE